MGSLFFFFFLQKKNSCLFLDFLPFSRTLEVKDIFNSLLPAAFPGGILSDTQEGPRRRTFFHYEPRLQQEKRWAEITNTHLANGACFSFSHRLHGVFKSTERRKTFCVCCNTTILWRYFVTEAALSWTWTRVFCPLSVSGHTLKASPNTWSLVVLILQVLRYKLGVLGFKEWGVSMKVAVQLSYGKWRIQCFWSLTHTKDWGYLPKEAFFFFFTLGTGAAFQHWMIYGRAMGDWQVLSGKTGYKPDRTDAFTHGLSAPRCSRCSNMVACLDIYHIIQCDKCLSEGGSKTHWICLQFRSTTFSLKESYEVFSLGSCACKMSWKVQPHTNRGSSLPQKALQ